MTNIHTQMMKAKSKSSAKIIQLYTSVHHIYTSVCSPPPFFWGGGCHIPGLLNMEVDIYISKYELCFMLTRKLYLSWFEWPLFIFLVMMISSWVSISSFFNVVSIWMSVHLLAVSWRISGWMEAKMSPPIKNKWHIYKRP